MLDFKQTNVEEMPYLYVQKTCSMDPNDIGNAMGEAFQTVWEFIEKQKITTAEKALAVYYTYDPNEMTFRAGFSVSKEDAAKAAGDIKADVTPRGKVLTFTHVGSYARLRDSYDEMMRYLGEKGLTLSVPTWEVYVNDPHEVSEEELRTDVFVALQ